MTKKEIDMIAEAVVEAMGRMVPPQQKEFMTLEEAAQYTGLTKNALYKMTHGRQIPYSKPSGKKCFFRRVDLEAWMMSNPVATREEIDARVRRYVDNNPINAIR